MKPTTTKLEWRNKQPYSSQYEDVYFSTDNGLAESEYVFIQGNQLHERWQAMPSNQSFTIIETGFGTGLNFCCAAKAWLNAQNEGKLHFISVEKYPLSLEAIHQALALWPTLSEISTALVAQYKTLEMNQVDGHVKLTVLPNIDLSLYLGDVIAALENMTDKTNAWFLDGFAPAKNPEMWKQSVFDAMAKLSDKDATLATFTSAGNVRRGLIQAGFDIKKREGFGQKREMLIGRWRGLGVG